MGIFEKEVFFGKLYRVMLRLHGFVSFSTSFRKFGLYATRPSFRQGQLKEFVYLGCCFRGILRVGI